MELRNKIQWAHSRCGFIQYYVGLVSALARISTQD
jgi:hypothetical protein